MEPRDNYLSLMQTIRSRFDVIEELKESAADPFSRAEAAAFHGRKIVEAIAFACLLAIENGLKTIPRDAKGQWNAESIFKSLKSKRLEVLPSPSHIRQATTEEQSSSGVNVVIEGIPEKRLTHEELRYCQMLWIAFDHAASFSSTLLTNSPLTNTAPALTRQTR